MLTLFLVVGLTVGNHEERSSVVVQEAMARTNILPPYTHLRKGMTAKQVDQIVGITPQTLVEVSLGVDGVFATMDYHDLHLSIVFRWDNGARVYRVYRISPLRT